VYTLDDETCQDKRSALSSVQYIRRKLANEIFRLSGTRLKQLSAAAVERALRMWSDEEQAEERQTWERRP